MADETRPEDLKLLVRCLRLLADSSQAELAAAAGVDPSSVQRWEKGRPAAPRRAVERLAAAAGLPLPFVDGCLQPALAAVRAARSGETFAELAAAAAGLDRALAGAGRAGLAAFLAALAEEGNEEEPWEAGRNEPPSARDRERDEELWRRLAPRTTAERCFLLRRCRELHRWPLVERLCHESAAAASASADEAAALADLALWLTERVGTGAWRARLEGYARAYHANALRVRGKLREADTEMARAWAQWTAGAASDPGLLAEWRLLDLEASLRRGQRRFAEALDLHARALGAATAAAAGRILLKKAATLDQMGEAREAVATLREAAPLLEGYAEPRHLFGLQFNLASGLGKLGRWTEAEALLPEVRRRAAGLERGVDDVRVAWLEGRVAAGRGREQEAAAGFAEVRQRFLARGMAYDYALASLDLAVLHLERGRASEVRELAREMLRIFAAQRVHRETLAALRLFRDAAERDTATAALARRLAGYLERARHDPDLRFGP